MKSNEEINFLKNTLSEDELKTYCKGAIFIANKEDRQDDVVKYSNTFNDTINQIPKVKPSDDKTPTITPDEVKAAIDDLIKGYTDHHMPTIDEAMSCYRDDLRSQGLRDMVQGILNNK